MAALDWGTIFFAFKSAPGAALTMSPVVDALSVLLA
jgi:hypothetical protein